MTTFQNDQLAPPSPDPVTPRRKPSTTRRVLQRLIPPLILLVIAIGIWQFVCYVMLDPTRLFLLPPLQTVIDQSFFV